MTLSFLILCGGESRRMGHPKQDLPWCDGTLWSHLAALAQTYPFDQVVTSIRDADSLPKAATAFPDMVFLADASSHCGPLSGLSRALSAITSDYCLTASTDLPFYDFSFLHRCLDEGLLTPAADGRRPVIIPVAGGREQPLAGLYPTDLAPAAQAMLARGTYRIRQLYEAWPVRFVDADHGLAYFNVNTPDDYALACALRENPLRRVPILSLIGDSGSGKTTKAVKIIKLLTAQGLRVGYIKSTHHQVRGEKEGSDTWLARQAGASSIHLIGPQDVPADTSKKEYLYALSQDLDVDVTLIESRSHGTAPFIKEESVWMNIKK